MYIGDVKYPVSNMATIYQSATVVQLTFVKMNDKNVMFVDARKSIKTIEDKDIIYYCTGMLKIHLDDETIISCSDTKWYSFINDKGSTGYFLTDNELKKMKNSNIKFIVYNMSCRFCPDSTAKTYSLDNVDYLTLSGSPQYTVPRADVSKIISDYFK